MNATIYKFVFLLGFLTFSQPLSAQCDTLYTTVDESAYYGEEKHDLLKFMAENLIIDRACIDGDMLPSKLRVDLVIGNQGKVISAQLVFPELTSECKITIEQMYLEMENWHPAVLNGKNVCSEYHAYIGCLKYD